MLYHYAVMASGRIDLSLAHSPDADDAFMWWPLFEIDGHPPCIESPTFRFKQVTADIETLNSRSVSEDFDITAISCAQYPYVQQIYSIMPCGSSLGDGFGPKLVSATKISVSDLRNTECVVAIPGERTSAFAALRMFLGQQEIQFSCVPFGEIIDRVSSGEFTAGVIIHEGQLTFEQFGLHCIADLGEWWTEQCGLPLPLGLNVIRRDIDDRYGPESISRISSLLSRSIKFALAHREQSLDYAQRFSRGMNTQILDHFVKMYVNEWTVELGRRGGDAVVRFLAEIAQAGIAPPVNSSLFVGLEMSNVDSLTDSGGFLARAHH